MGRGLRGVGWAARGSGSRAQSRWLTAACQRFAASAMRQRHERRQTRRIGGEGARVQSRAKKRKAAEAAGGGGDARGRNRAASQPEPGETATENACLPFGYLAPLVAGSGKNIQSLALARACPCIPWVGWQKSPSPLSSDLWVLLHTITTSLPRYTDTDTQDIVLYIHTQCSV